MSGSSPQARARKREWQQGYKADVRRGVDRSKPRHVTIIDPFPGGYTLSYDHLPQCGCSYAYMPRTNPLSPWVLKFAWASCVIHCHLAPSHGRTHGYGY